MKDIAHRLQLSRDHDQVLVTLEDRDKAFVDDGVLQENIIFHAVRGGRQGDVTITASSGGDFDDLTERIVDFNRVVRPDNPERFIHIATSRIDEAVEDRMYTLTNRLRNLDVSVCTGPVEVSDRCQSSALHPR